MIVGDISPDGEVGGDNALAIDAIRQTLSTQFDDGIPFLLLPVRLETRFVKTEQVAEGGGVPLSQLNTDVAEALATLEAVGQRDLATSFEGADREAVKLAEAAHATFLDDALQSTEAAIQRWTVMAMRCGASDAADRALLASLGERVGTQLSAALTTIEGLRSAYQRSAYKDRFQALAQSFAPCWEMLRDRVLPALEILEGLRNTPARDMLSALDLVDNTLRTRADSGFKSVADAVDLLAELEDMLAAARASARGLLQGSPDQLTTIQSRWTGISEGLAALTPSMQKLSGTSEERLTLDERVRTLNDLHDELQGLGGRDRFQWIGSKRIQDSAAAAQVVRALLDRLVLDLDTPPVAPSRRIQAILATTQRIADHADHVVALTRDISILPAQWLDAVLARLQDVHDRLPPFLDQLDKVVRLTSGSAGAQGLRERLDTSIAAVDAAWNAQRSDRSVPRTAQEDTTVYATLDEVTEVVDELRVRIYPDDIAVHTHEEPLTQTEREGGAEYWGQVISAGPDEALQRGAWRALVARHGVRRAAWIARVTQVAAPTTPTQVAEALRALDTLEKRSIDISTKPRAMFRDPTGRAARLRKATLAAHKAVVLVKSASPAQIDAIRSRIAGVKIRTDALVGRRQVAASSFRAVVEDSLGEVRSDLAALEDAAKAIEPVSSEAVALPAPPESKTDAWTRAPHVRVMPDRFVVVAVRLNRVVHLVAGGPVGDISVGLDPDPAHAADETFALDGQGRLEIGASIRWMVEYDEAVQKGMAITVPITPQEASIGFDRVFVVGIRNTSAAEGSALVEGLLDNHHYGAEGLAFLPVGTPTNNGDAGAAGYRSDDDDDADGSFFVELGQVLTDDGAVTPWEAPDGWRFATALGISPQRVEHLPHATANQAVGVRSLNRALWPATIGSYMEDFLGTFVATDTIRRAEAFFCDNVSARGWIPSIRVGDQPYGVLTTTAFGRYIPATGATYPAIPAGGPDALAGNLRAPRFNLMLRDILAIVLADFDRIRASKVKHAHNMPTNGDAQQHFLDMLGLQATSQAHSVRFSLNAAGRHPAAAGSGGPLDFRYGIEGPLGLLGHFFAMARDALGLPPGYLRDTTGRVAAPYVGIHDQIAASRLFGVRYLEQPGALVGEVADDPGSWLQALAARSPDALWDEAGEHAGDTTSLLYLLLRHAILNSYREAALTILEHEGVLDKQSRIQAGSPESFLVRSLRADRYLTKWSFLLTPLSQLDGRLGNVFPTDPTTLYPYLKTAGAEERTMVDYLTNRGNNALRTAFPRHSEHDAVVARLADHGNALARLDGVASAALPDLLSEHLDLCSHRLDAWILGLAHQRLADMRETHSTGVYVGAYGWIEHLRPSAPRALATNLHPSLHIPGEPNVYVDGDNQGFVHAPTLNHAVTAAILRSGYLSEADSPDRDNHMAVNLTSGRIRRALALIDGVKEGHDLGALLGYRFERRLHDAYQASGVVVDDVIFAMRTAYPTLAAVDPGQAQVAQSRRLVLDGLTVLDTVRDALEYANPLPHDAEMGLFDRLYGEGTYPGFPWGIMTVMGDVLLPLPTDPDGPARLDAVLRAIDEMANGLDAVADLALSESVYQLVRGNHVRAMAVLGAMGQGRAIPTPQITDLPRGGAVISQRVLFQLEPNDGVAPPGWEAAPMTPRALAEPTLNQLVSELLAPPEDILARIVSMADPPSPDVLVSVADLGLQPIDLLALLGGGIERAETDLVARVMDRFHRQLDPADFVDGHTPPVRVALASRDGLQEHQRSFLEVCALIEDLQGLIASAKPAQPDHYRLVEDEIAPMPGSALIDSSELEARIDASIQGAWSVVGQFMGFLDPMTTYPPAQIEGVDAHAFLATHADAVFADPQAVFAQREVLADLLLGAAGYGIERAGPPPLYQGADTSSGLLRQRFESAFSRLVARARAAATARADAGPEDAARAASTLFGETMLVLPRFQLTDTTQITDALAPANRPANVDPLAIDAWLTGVAVVRANLARLTQTFAVADAFGKSTPQGTAMELPRPTAQPHYWCGAECPPDEEPDGDRVSLVIFGADRLVARPNEVVGLLIDRWVEVIPATTQTTGIAFFYDQPDAAPPNSLLLAVPPETTGNWSWDDLVHTLEDTLHLARCRTVELEHLFDDPLYGQLLPAVAAEMIPPQLGNATVGNRVVLHFTDNNPPPDAP